MSKTPITLYIAEKPSLGRAVAEVLPKPHKKGDGFIKVGNGDVVSWCIGHLLEQAQPEAYNAAYKKWSIEHLPIIPTEWKLEVKPKTKKQFSILKKLIKEADVLVNVGDPDREGQILIDEVINHCAVSNAKKRAAKRCLISDLNANAVKRSLENLRDNHEFVPLATSALARARADWLYGINMTRLCTLKGQRSGFQGVLSVGRVQTPLLGLVVYRDLEIENFKAKPFYEVTVDLKTQKEEVYKAKWKPSAACEDYMDEDGRVLSRQLAENVIERVKNCEGKIVKVQENKKKQAPPLPYNLSTLQIDAARRYGLSAKDVLDICQGLYEKHKLITYPRSDSRYLPEEHYAGASGVSKAIAKTRTDLQEIVTGADFSIKSKAWNDSKVSAHHAIIPTMKVMDGQRLSVNEANVYDLVAKQYLVQFYPHYEYVDKQIDTEVAGGLFVARQTDPVAQGWKIVLFPRQAAAAVKKPDKNAAAPLPKVKVNDQVACIDAALIEKETTPPRHFTDATLLSAMTGIARYVSDTAIKKVLRETDGLGTEATRAGIIELLFRREYLTRKGKEIHSTDIGRQLITSLPEKMGRPDMTAHWESQLDAISQREINYAHFMHPMTAGLNDLVYELNGVVFSGLRGQGTATGKRKVKKFSKSKKPATKKAS